MGLKLLQSGNPEADADRDAACASAGGGGLVGSRCGSALRLRHGVAMGHFFEEEIGADWFENPVLCEDVGAYARLAGKLELPLAAERALRQRRVCRLPCP